MYPKEMKYKIWKDKLNGKVKSSKNLLGSLRCKYLLLIEGQGDDLIAKQWKRKKPQLKENEYLIEF